MCDSGGECGTPTLRLLPLPAPATAATPWYSLDIGLVHLIALSTEHDFSTGSPQLAWLVADLAAVNRSRTPWVIAGLHRPMYIDSTYDGPWTSDQVVARLLRRAFHDEVERR